MSTEMIIRHCAPTLAGLKLGNLFSYKYTSKKELVKTIYNKNKLLNSKDVYFTILKMKDGMALIYVYRKHNLEEALKIKDNIEFLKLYGYSEFKIEKCLSILSKHLLNKTFPHEIGVFLGYPLEDIKAFIKNKGENCKCVGCWKAYTNICEAKKTFQKYKKCTNIYCEKFSKGFDIMRLTIAG